MVGIHGHCRSRNRRGAFDMRNRSTAGQIWDTEGMQPREWDDARKDKNDATTEEYGSGI